jgi:RNA polymerase sigma factor (sigma-70 family)
MRGNRADAEDALSQAMMKAWDRLPGCAGKITNLGAWLTRLTHNLCLDMHRERERRTRDVQSLEEITVANEAALAQTMQSPEETVLRHELYGYILHAIDNLPSRLREPFILRFLQEMPYPDIAKQLALSPENVRKRIQQARAILRGRLNPYLSRVDGFGRENPGSHQPATFNREAPMIGQRPLNREEPEVKSKIVATRVVQVILPSGMERSFHIFLNHKPTKPHFRIKTLGMYVQHHPQGWKKRLELANFLYAVGCWEEAIQDYRQVLERQPRLFNVWLQLGNILHLMEREEGAIAAYGSALPLTRKVATQHHVSGLIEACRRHHEAATREFEEAASLEPHNVAHWRLLGLAHLRAENSHEALGAFDEALKIDPDDLVALTRSYEALRAVGREEEAQQRVGRVLLIVPNDVLALKRMADHRSQSGLVRGPAGTETRRLIRRAQRLNETN